MNEYNVAMTEETHETLTNFLLDDIEDEEICFATWYPAKGKTRLNVLIKDIILPEDGDRKRHGNVSAMPQYLDRVKEVARVNHAGIVMIHTHPHGKGSQDVSEPDLLYEQDKLSREIFGYTGYPLVGMTLSGDAKWSARIYPKPYKIQWCSGVRIVGKNLTIHFNPKLKPKPKPSKKQLRTSSVWGQKLQDDIMRMRIGIIGVGSVGFAVGEILARLGVGQIHLMDYDIIKIHNLDRLISVLEKDIGQNKVDVLAKNLKNSATNEQFFCTVSTSSVVEKQGFEEALDCDVIFSCVDRPWPRQIMNHLSYSSLIPVINGGVSFNTKNNVLVHGVYRTQTVGPQRCCMSCHGAYDSSIVQQDRDGLFDDPDYVKTQEQETGLLSRQNIMPFVFSLGGIETTQFVELTTNLAKIGDLGEQEYNYATGTMTPTHRNCIDSCFYQKIIGLGDTKLPVQSSDKSKIREIEEKQGAIHE